MSKVETLIFGSTPSSDCEEVEVECDTGDTITEIRSFYNLPKKDWTFLRRCPEFYTVVFIRKKKKSARKEKEAGN